MEKFKEILAEEMVKHALEIGMNDVPTKEETLEYINSDELNDVMVSIESALKRWQRWIKFN